jgi:hypothetical protein
MVRRFRIGILSISPVPDRFSPCKWTCGIPMRNEAGEVGKYLVIMTRIESGEEGSHLSCGPPLGMRSDLLAATRSGPGRL